MRKDNECDQGKAIKNAFQLVEEDFGRAGFRVLRGVGFGVSGFRVSG